MKSFLLIPMFIVILMGCEKEGPPIDEATYVKLLTEAAIIQSAYNVKYDTLITSSMFEEVLLSYAIDRNEFLYSHLVYQQDLQGQERRWKIVLDSLTEQSSQLMKP